MKRRWLQTVVFLWVAATLLAGCSLLAERKDERGPSLLDLQPAVRFYQSPAEQQAWSEQAGAGQADSPSAPESAPQPTPEKALENYRALLELTEDARIRQSVLHRIAGLEMLISERKQADAATDSEGKLPESYYHAVIENYQNLLVQFPQSEENDRLLYQLAKAFDLDGRQDDSLQTLDKLVSIYPDSPYYAEAQFRRAEIFFSRKEYHLASRAYKQVIDQGEDSAFYQNAFYMHGWSLFKLNRYENSLYSFTRVLDRLGANAVSPQQLSTSQATLADDTFRIMSLVFSYLDSGQSIARLYEEIGSRPYESQLYERLGELLVSQERYGDSANTYENYIERYPGSSQAPYFHVKLIAVYKDGNFPSKLLPEKERFVRSYGIYSDYWQTADSATKQFLLGELYQYIPELAQYYHARAQMARQQIKTKKKPGKGEQESVRLAYGVAAQWYRQFIDTFPKDFRTGDNVFLMAETLFESGDYLQAIAAYERTAYDYSHHPRGSDAGYAAVLAYQHYIDELPADSPEEIAQRLLWQQQRVDSQRRYAEQYRDDKRAVEVLVNAAEELLLMRNYQEAIVVGTQLTQWQSLRPDAANAVGVSITAWLVIGHSHFELEHYKDAEDAYLQALALMDAAHTERSAVIERLAASVYKQGEQRLLVGETLLAVEDYLRIKHIAPQSAIRISAEYDAATHLMALKEWARAIDVMTAFRNNWPDHAFARDIPARLAMAYQENQQWALAASELKTVWKSDPDKDVQRQALFLSAELFEKSGDAARAIDSYRSYAHEYPQPFAVAMEARFKLSELYQQSKQDKKRRYWLKKMIDADASAGDDRSDRSRYLAAMSCAVFADDSRWAFNKIKLTLPLKRSLSKKKQAMKKTIDLYQQTADYGIEEFSTKAVYHIGEIYVQLSRDLMESDRPRGLNELELEQYEILLEEQAYPFEEKAIEILAVNSQLSWQGSYDLWVRKSFESLSGLLPARYNKPEKRRVVSETIY